VHYGEDRSVLDSRVDSTDASSNAPLPNGFGVEVCSNVEVGVVSIEEGITDRAPDEVKLYRRESRNQGSKWLTRGECAELFFNRGPA
jgi:hypothetical protein